MFYLTGSDISGINSTQQAGEDNFMTGPEILNNISYAFWLVLGEPFLAIFALFLIYSVVLAFYTLIIKR